MNAYLCALALSSGMLLSGCTATGYVNEQLEQGVEQGRAVVDDLNSKALWQLCEGMTLGGWMRLSPEIRVQLDGLCKARWNAWQSPGGTDVGFTGRK